MSLVVQSIFELKNKVSEWKKEGLKIGLVPTMGALHYGHESLIEKACATCDKIIVSVFVNPKQFGPNEDFDKYPRTLSSDSKICSSHGVDVIFAPDSKEIYPHKHPTMVIPSEFYQNKLCGQARKGHFDGVATIVLKLFNITQADVAFFGQKDAQQLIIIEKMVADLNIPIEIVRCPLVRDEDGLAMSSRNEYLSAEARKKALCLYKILLKIKELYESGEYSIDVVKKDAIKMLDHSMELEYLDFYKISNFEKAENLSKETLVAIAAKIDGIRLIDNCVL